MKREETARQIDTVLASHRQQLNNFESLDISELDERVSSSENLLQSLGYQLPEKETAKKDRGKACPHIPSWEEVLGDAEAKVGIDHEVEELFSEEDLKENPVAIKELNEKFNEAYRLDALEISICIGAGVIAGLVDAFLAGALSKTRDGVQAGPLANSIRAYVENRFPEEEMSKLAEKPFTKVPYDAQDNRNTAEWVEGLSAYYHRLYSLGHDPLVGLIVGVADIMSGTMTTIDKNGVFRIQIMECYKDRTERDVFAAVAKQIRHFFSDVNTPMGLPVPLASLFNFAQFGHIGKDDQTIAEIAQGMYAEGYDFKHFCSLSIPTMFVEAAVRLGYGLKRISEGHTIAESIPVSLDRVKNPKLATMLFIAHSAAVGINAGKVAVNIVLDKPDFYTAINYTEWLAFAKYGFQQAKWILYDKPEMRHDSVVRKLDKDLEAVYRDIDTSFLFDEGK